MILYSLFDFFQYPCEMGRIGFTILILQIKLQDIKWLV